MTPLAHQREWWAASDGLTLLDVPDLQGQMVLVTAEGLQRGDYVQGEVELNGIQCYRVPRMVVPRVGGNARFLADLGAFKVGKSWGAAMWASGLAIIPGRKISLIGAQYDMVSPEFDYIVEFLLSERGMNMPYETCINNPRNGDMVLVLENGTKYEARSWERKDSLKGKEIDAYIYCEAYQLPGIECLTGFSQNLRVRRGFGVFATTPDRPWVKELHDLGHGEDEEFHCTCSVPAEANPVSFDMKAKIRDEKLMTREKFAIHYGGKLGDFVGRVFNYQRGSGEFTSGSFPALFEGGEGRDHLRIPPGWEVAGGLDTGTYYTGLLVAFSPEGDAFVLDEFPNYRYVGGAPERDESLSIPQWAAGVVGRTTGLGARAAFWADANSQFKLELRNYGITVLANKATKETRTEIAREYFQHGKIYLAPWLVVLPFELENAAWPEEATAAGRFERVKDRDHTLDCLEHVLSKRPRGEFLSLQTPRGQWKDQFQAKRQSGNIHLGAN